MVIFFVQMKLSKFAYLYSKPLGNHTLKIMKKYLEIYLKTWKNHGNIMEFCQSGKWEPWLIVQTDARKILAIRIYICGCEHTQ